MDIFEQLRSSVAQQQQQAELPDELAEQIGRIIAEPQRYQQQTALLHRLQQQVEDYDAYGDCGCFAGGCSLGEVQRTLRQLQAGTQD